MGPRILFYLCGFACSYLLLFLWLRLITSLIKNKNTLILSEGTSRSGIVKRALIKSCGSIRKLHNKSK
jgi:hypothetical protein